MVLLLIAVVLFLSYSNGANDNFKGVATLFGTGTADYRKALIWATLTTFAGSAISFLLAGSLVKNFSGKGLVPDELLLSPEFAISIALGAALTVFIAAKTGIPISTTHSLVGALTGAGLIGANSYFNFSMLGNNFFMPLILSPLIAAGFSIFLYLFFAFSRRKLGVTKESCLCVSEEASAIGIQTAGVINYTSIGKPTLSIKKGTLKECSEVYSGTIAGVNAQKTLDVFHYLSAGAVGFSRGLNDTPKIAGLLLLVNLLDIHYGILLIALAMAVGGWLNANKVAETMSNKITAMNHGQGFTANLVTALLVSTASVNGLPVSTTHVSVGSLFGIGAVTKKANSKVIAGILISWVTTLPLAALLSALIYFLIK